MCLSPRRHSGEGRNPVIETIHSRAGGDDYNFHNTQKTLASLAVFLNNAGIQDTKEEPT